MIMGPMLDFIAESVLGEVQYLLFKVKRMADGKLFQTRLASLLHWDGEQPLSLDEQRQIVQRWIEYEKRKGPCRQYFDGESDASDARPHVRLALCSYNSRHPGAEFDAVRPSMVECASFRGQIWFRVNFLARRRGSIDAPVLCFFAELRYYGDFVEKVSVESCVILQEEPLFVRRIETVQDAVHLTTKMESDQEPRVEYRRKRAFCIERHGILHPSDDGLVCGKEGQLMEPSTWL